MIFRLISSQLGSPSPNYGSHIIMSISGIFFTYINPHIIILKSYLKLRCTKSHKSHPQYLGLNTHVLSSAAWHQLTPPAGPSLYIFLLGGQTAPSVLDRGHLTTCPTSLSAVSVLRISAHDQQPCV